MKPPLIFRLEIQFIFYGLGKITVQAAIITQMALFAVPLLKLQINRYTTGLVVQKMFGQNFGMFIPVKSG
jgi:hypothetical protein